MRYLFFSLIGICILGCRYDNNTSANFNYNVTFELPYGKVVQDNNQTVSIKIDSILYDARCPLGFNCFWEGNARVRFKFKCPQSQSDIVLNTYVPFSNDTIINGYTITLLSLSPIPKSGVKTEQYQYKATMRISR